MCSRNAKGLRGPHFGIGKEFVRLFNEPQFHDVIIRPESDLDNFLYAHGDIIALGSSVLGKAIRNAQIKESEELSPRERASKLPFRVCKTFDFEQTYSDILESVSTNRDCVVELVFNADYETIHVLFRFLYSGELRIKQRKSDESYCRIVLQLISIAESLELHRLQAYLIRKKHQLQRIPPYEEILWSAEEVNPQRFATLVAHLQNKSSYAAILKYIPISPALMSSRSLYFRALLQGRWVDGGHLRVHCGEESEIGIVVEKVVRYIHMEESVDDFSFKNVHELIELLQAGLYFGVTSLVNHCSFLLRLNYITAEHVCYVWNIASDQPETESLSQKCEEFLQENFIACALHEGFLFLRKDLLKSCLDAGKITAESLEMVQAIRKWADAAARRSGRPQEASELFLQMLPPFTLFNVQNRLMLLGGRQTEIRGLPRQCLVPFLH